jgi:SAM-dependent methyltransferase
LARQKAENREPASWRTEKARKPAPNGTGAAAVGVPAATPAEREPLRVGPCPACDSNDYRVLFEATDRLYRTTPGTFRIVECGRCRLIRLEPRPAGDSALEHPTRWPRGDLLADRIEQAFRRFVLNDHVSFVVRAVEEAGETGPVLDLSPDGGLFRAVLAQRGVRVIGIDCSHSAATESWTSHNAPSLCARLTAAPVAPGSCAAITMLHVLEHLSDPFACVAAAYDLLRPGGRLVVETPNAACWEFLLLGENWNGLDVPRHLVDFRGCDLESLLRSCGFDIVRRKHFSLRDNPGGLARSLAPGLDPVVRRARNVEETPSKKLMKHLLWFGLMVAAVPFTVLEAACRAGSNVVIDARKRS